MAMVAVQQDSRVAVVCGKQSSRAPAMQACIEDLSICVTRWFEPTNLHDLDEAVRCGELDRVIFATINDLLNALWDHQITVHHWLRRSVQIHFLDPAAGKDDDSVAKAVLEAWASWDSRSRRRKMALGVILSAVIILSAFVLLFYAS